jgi:hypothetical protein
MRTMYDDGMIKALDGITTVEEVLQVTRDVYGRDFGRPESVDVAGDRHASTMLMAGGADAPWDKGRLQR